MSIRRHLSVIIICILVFTKALFSQITVQGTVSDNGAEYLGDGSDPVENVLVTVIDQADISRSFSVYTDAQGYYEIQITETGVDGIPTQKPKAFNLFQNYPNPFNPSTIITYELREPANIRIDIYNILGQKIKTVFDGFQNALTGHFVWDATDDLGQGVSAGVYIYSLKTEGIRINKKMLLLDGHQSHVNTTLSAKGMKLSSQTVSTTQMSDQYLLRVTGDSILTYEQQDLEITENITLDITAIRAVTDIDGNVYRTVKIDDQWWMAEDLKVTHYRNGEAIPNETDNSTWAELATGAYCNYDNDTTNAPTYGRLYNWYAVEDSRNIAPEGWHVPTDNELKALEVFLGMSQESADGTGFRGIDVGGKFKETGTTHWEDPNTGATNESGFSARPGGFCASGGNFYTMGNEAYFWSSTEGSSGSAWFRALKYDHSYVNRNTLDNNYGFSVRCVKNQDTLTATIETLGEAGELYQSVFEIQGRAAAVTTTIDYLNDHDLVTTAVMTSDSSITVFYKNGLQGCIGNPLVRGTATPAPAVKKQIAQRTFGGSEVNPGAVILAPFYDEFQHDSPDRIKDRLDECFGGAVPEPDGKKTELYKNSEVSVPNLIINVLGSGPGVLLWIGHGCMVRIDEDAPSYQQSSDEWCALMTGEGYSEKELADMIADFYEAFFGRGVMHEIVVIPYWRWGHKPMFYLLVTPAFIINHANFDIPGDLLNCDKSLVYIDCCNSADSYLADAFMEKGADVYLGWTAPVSDTTADKKCLKFINEITDTCTVGEAFDLLGNVVDPSRGAELKLMPSDDPSIRDIMIRAQMRMTKDGTALRGYSVGVTVNSNTGVTTVGCWSEPEGLTAACNINVRFPGAGPGSFNCASDDDASISLMDTGTGKTYVLWAGLFGVQGNINVRRYDSDRVSGTFSGTLGYWEQGQNPTEDPPSETVNIQNGFIKHIGSRIQL